MIDQTILLRDVLFHNDELALTVDEVQFFEYSWFPCHAELAKFAKACARFGELHWIGIRTKRGKYNESIKCKQVNECNQSFSEA